jgi:hypothetical protein
MQIFVQTLGATLRLEVAPTTTVQVRASHGLSAHSRDQMHNNATRAADIILIVVKLPYVPCGTA